MATARVYRSRRGAPSEREAAAFRLRRLGFVFQGHNAVRGNVVEAGRRVGRKKVRTDDPTERQDARFVEVVVALEGAPPTAIGTRVEGYIGG